jgi:prepilin-type N-terminal cleavage/methylation domain-containing protein
MNKHGFTLIELVIGVSLTSMLMVIGSFLFYRGLGLGSETQSNVNINAAVTTFFDGMNNFMRFRLIESVGQGGVNRSRFDCETSYPNAVTGESIVISDKYGASEYRLIENRIASVSGNPIMLTPAGVRIRDLSFDWYCQPGSVDRVIINLEARDASQSSDLRFAPFTKEVYLYNSGFK